eukprot:gene10467-biopygen4658
MTIEPRVWIWDRGHEYGAADMDVEPLVKILRRGHGCQSGWYGGLAGSSQGDSGSGAGVARTCTATASSSRKGCAMEI